MMKFSDTFKLRALLGMVAALLLVAYQFAEPLPPLELKIATGREGGGYYGHSLHYQAYLGQRNVILHLVPGAGSLTALQRLNNGEVEIGLIQGGTAHSVPHDNLVSVASLFYEPVWVFHRSSFTLHTVGDLKGKRIGVGEDNSGTQALAVQLLHANQVNADNAQFISASGKETARLLVEGQLDAGIFVMSPKGEIVHELLGREDITLFSFTRAPAYERRFSYLTGITLPEGSLDLERNLPKKEVTLLAATASLVARREIPTEVLRLLVRMAIEQHQDGSLLASPGQFPSANGVEIPIHPEAQRYLKSARQRGLIGGS